MELSHLHQQRQYILSSLSKNRIIMDGLHTKIADAERSLTTKANASSKIKPPEDSSRENGSSTNNGADAKAHTTGTGGLGRTQKKKLQQTRWRARTSLRNCENEQQILLESLRGVQDRILRMQTLILDKDGAGSWVFPPPAAAHHQNHQHQHQANPDPTAVMAAYAANFYAGTSIPLPYAAHSHSHAHPQPANPYTHYPHGIPPSAYLDPGTTPDDLWAWQASDTHGPYAALAPSLLSNDPYQYAYLYQNQEEEQYGGYDYEWADWDAAGRRFSCAARSSRLASAGGSGPGPKEVVDEKGTHHYIYGDKGKDGHADWAAAMDLPSNDETGGVAPGVFPKKWELGRPSLTVSTAARDGPDENIAPTSASTSMRAALSGAVHRGHKRVQSTVLSPKTSIFMPGKVAHSGGGESGAAAMPTKSALATIGGSNNAAAADSHPHVHFAEQPPHAQNAINPRATPFKAPSSPYPFPQQHGGSGGGDDNDSSKAKSQPYTPPHRRNLSLNSTASSSSFVSIDYHHHDAKQDHGNTTTGKRRYSAAAVDLILNRLKENGGKPRKRRGQGHAHSRSVDADAGNRRESGNSEEGEGENGSKKRGRQGVGWGSIDEPKYKVGGIGENDGDVNMEGVD